jgi:FMN phosphatase YigB (HAD superfamily)
VDATITTLLFDLGGVVCEFDSAPRLARLAALSGLPETEVHARLWTSGLTVDFDRGHYSTAEWHRLVSDRLGVVWEFDLMEEVFLSAFRVNEAVLELARLHVPPEEVLFIDDVPANLEAARDVGMRGCHFTSASDLKRDRGGIAAYAGLLGNADVRVPRSVSQPAVSRNAIATLSVPVMNAYEAQSPTDQAADSRGGRLLRPAPARRWGEAGPALRQ